MTENEELDTLKKTNQELQDNLTKATDSIEELQGKLTEMWEAEAADLFKELLEITTLTEEELKKEVADLSPEDTVKKLSTIKEYASVGKPAGDIKPVGYRGPESTPPSKKGYTVGQWDAKEGKWVK